MDNVGPIFFPSLVHDSVSDTDGIGTYVRISSFYDILPSFLRTIMKFRIPRQRLAG